LSSFDRALLSRFVCSATDALNLLAPHRKPRKINKLDVDVGIVANSFRPDRLVCSRVNISGLPIGMLSHKSAVNNATQVVHFNLVGEVAEWSKAALC
ncbi:MAG: hypothetical protein ACOYM3_33210, partial [Terrimicrobiaceae bacterium]